MVKPVARRYKPLLEFVFANEEVFPIIAASGRGISSATCTLKEIEN